MSKEAAVQGTLTLSHPPLNDLDCLLMLLDENGCCARISFQRLPAEHAVAWKRLLLPNLQLTLTVDMPGKIKFQSHGMLERAKEFYIYCDYYFHFSLETAQRTAIQRALGQTPKQSSVTLPVVRTKPPTARVNQVPPRKDTATLPVPTVQAAGDMVTKSRKLGEILVHMGHLTAKQAEKAAVDAKANGERIGRHLIRVNLVPAKTVCHALALQSGLPMVDLGGIELKPSLSTLFPYTVLNENHCVPFDATKTSVFLAVVVPLSGKAMRELKHACGRQVQMFVAEEDLITKNLDQIFRGRKPRKFTRYACSIPVQYEFCGRLGSPIEETIHSDMVVNISQGGMAFYCAPTIPDSIADMRRTDVYVNVLLYPDPADDYEIRAICQLRWVRRRGSEPLLLGVEIVEIAVKDQQRLKEVCMRAAQGP